MLSSFPPRRQAETIPSPVPRMKARIVVMPTRPTVHQIALPMRDVTEAGYSESEMPKLPVNTLCR